LLLSKIEQQARISVIVESWRVVFRNADLIDADSGNVRNLTNNADYKSSPAWSPDGTEIALASNRKGNYAIYVMDTDGTHLLRLTDNLADDTSPDWFDPNYPRPVASSGKMPRI
jgi:Tol biopolymer transport system component